MATPAAPGRLGDNLIAGAITAILLVPQGMAYAVLAGLPPQLGLYASILPPAVYALLGSSRNLSVGPVAVAALMVASALGAYAQGDPERWANGAVVLAAETGIVLLLLRALRLGSLVSFVSHPVLIGFTAGAALLIITSQLDALLGLALPRGGPGTTLPALWRNLSELDPLTAGIGLASISLLLASRCAMEPLLRRLGLPLPAISLLSRAMPLGLVVGAILLVSAMVPEQRAGLALVGPLPAGLPLPSLAFLSSSGWIDLAPSALLIALVGYVESMSVAKVLAAQHRDRLDADRELLALGASNLAAALVSSMPVAGGFSRSVVNAQAGANSQLASLISAALVALVALFFTAWFAHLPYAVLAAIIVVAVAQLIDVSAARSIFAYDPTDGATVLATLIGVLIFGIELGLVLGILLALALYLRRTSHPHLAVLGQVPGTEHYRNVDRHSVQCSPGLLILRVDENLYFANIVAVEDGLEAALKCHPHTTQVLLVMSAVSYIDSSALDTLEGITASLAKRGMSLHLAEVKGPVMDRFKATRLGRELAPRTYLSTHLAVQALTRNAA